MLFCFLIDQTYIFWEWRDSTGGMALSLDVADPIGYPALHMVHQLPAGIIPEHRAMGCIYPSLPILETFIFFNSVTLESALLNITAIKGTRRILR